MISGALALQVLRGGSPSSLPPSVSLSLAQGETASYAVAVTRSDTGAAENLTGGQLQFAASRRAGSTPVISRQLTITTAASGLATLELASDDTASLSVGAYVCDVWYTDSGGNRYPVTGLSALVLRPGIVTEGLAVTVLPSQAPLARGPGADGVAVGDLQVFDGTDWQVLSVGADGYVLTADSAQALDVKWAAPTPLTTKGDLLGRSSTALARVAVGSNGQVLTADSTQANGVKWATPTSGVSWYDVTAYGALGDGTTDDAAAIQAAIAAAIAAGGGRVYFPKTTSAWRIKTEVVSISTGSAFPNITLCGEAGAGPIRVAGAARINGFRFDNFGTIDFESLTFVEEAGDPGLTAALWYTGANNLRSTVRHCQFLGLSSNGSILTGLGIFQQYQDLHFGGCSAPSGFVVALLTSTSYVADCSFIDYGNHRGTYYSKTPSGVQAWIGGSGDWSLAQFDSVGNAPIVVERCHFDEGAAAAVQIYNSGYLTNYAPSLLVSDCTHLLPTPGGWYSVVAQGVMNVRVQRHAMKAQNNTGGAFNISYCQRFEADACWARGTAGAYYPPSSLGAYFVHIQDCEGIDTSMTLTASVFLATWEQYCLRGTYYTAEWTGGVANQAYPVKLGAADLGVTYMRTTDTSDMAIGCVIETTSNTKPVKVCTHGELRMKNDAFGSLVRGDKVGASPSEDGAVRKVTTGAYYGIVLAACAPSGIVRMRWMPGRF